jgi:hypothetical protein
MRGSRSSTRRARAACASPSRRCAPLLAVACAISLFASTAAQAKSVVERCKSADASFDYEVAVQECGLAAADTTISREEKILVYQLLGIAHTALKQDDRAETWFIRLLVLDASHALPSTVSPVYLKAFAAAKAQFEREGRVVVTQRETNAGDQTATGGLRVSYVVVDKLGRVRDARIRVRTFAGATEGVPVDVALTRSASSEPGAFELIGEVPNPGPPSGVTSAYRVEYRLVLLSAVGDEIASDPPVLPVAFEAAGTGEAEGVSPLLLVAGVGAGAAVLTVVAAVGVGVAIGVVCLTTELCSEPKSPARVIVRP